MKDYIEYDEYGPKRVGCMMCGETVKQRSYVEIEDKLNVGAKVQVMTVLAMGNLRQKRINIDVGGKPHSYMDAILCAECINKDCDHDAIMRQARIGWKKEMEFTGVSGIKVDMRMKIYDRMRLVK